MRLPAARNDPVWSRIRDHDVMEFWDHSIAPHVAATYNARMDLLCRLVVTATPPNGRVLDVGAAQGTLGLMLAEGGFRVTLLDVRPQCMEYARERYERGVVEFVTGRLSNTCPADTGFDTVVCTEVLEHAAVPGELLIGLRDKLRPGGALVLTTPNAGYWLAQLPTYSRAAQAVIDGAEPDSLDGDAHRYLFDKEELIALVRGAGLRVERHAFFSPFWLEGHLKMRYLHRLAYWRRHRILRWPTAIRGPLGRRVSSAQWLLARKHPSHEVER